VCQDKEVALREFRTFSEVLLRLTRDQTREGADAKYQIGVKALDKGWGAREEQAFIGKFLSSPEYLDLQREREPHRAAMAQVQALWRNSTSSVSAQELCESVRRAQDAVAMSYKLNKREQEVLAKMLDTE
jgi:hypothetical protein